MKAIVYEAENKLSLNEVAMPEIKAGYSLVKVAYSGICGGDLNIYFGTHPRAKAPLVMGHEFSGTLVGGHETLKEGTKVTVNPILSCGHCLPCTTGDAHVCETLKLIGIDMDGGMAEYVLVENSKIIPLPEEMDLLAGALVEPVAVAVHTIRETNYTPGDSAIVFGCGTIGLATAMVLKASGAPQVTVVETNPFRLNMAKELGFDVINPNEKDVIQEVLDRTSGSGFDVVYDCAGHQSVADLLPDVVKVKGDIIIVAGYKKAPTLNLIKGMFKEFSILFVRVYRNKDFEIATEMVKNNPDFAKLITHVLEKEDAQKGFDLMLDPSAEALKVIYKF